MYAGTYVIAYQICLFAYSFLLILCSSSNCISVVWSLANYLPHCSQLSSYSSDLRIIGFIALKDLRETKAELGKNKALYIKENYFVFKSLSSLNSSDVICGLAGLRFRVHCLSPTLSKSMHRWWQLIKIEKELTSIQLKTNSAHNTFKWTAVH